MPKLLLLSCCAPCSCAVIDNLAKENVDFAVLFYNPNISPAAEYEKGVRKTNGFAYPGMFLLFLWNTIPTTGLKLSKDWKTNRNGANAVPSVFTCA